MAGRVDSIEYGYQRRNHYNANPFRAQSLDASSIMSATGPSSNSGGGGNRYNAETNLGSIEIPTFQSKCPQGHDLRADVQTDNSNHES